MNQSFAQAVEAADFEAIKQCIGDVILQKQGHALAQALALEESQKLYVSRLLPVLHRWDQNQLTDAGLDRVRSQLEQQTVPAAVSALARFAPGWFVIHGCRPSPGPVEVVVLTIEGRCHLHRIKDACFRYQASRHAEDRLGHNYSFVSVFQLPDASGIRQIWINGVQVSCEIQNLSDSPYVDQIDDLLHIFQQAQVPFDRLPELVPQGPLEMAKMLREPLKCQTQWSNCIRQDNHFGVVASPTVHTTVVIPLYRLWHQFMQGHIAAFSIDSDFLDGQVEVMYVVDDPAIEHQVLNWARIYLHDCPYSVRIVSLIHNYGFGMACNIGVQAARTQRIVLVNSDVMPIREGWIKVLRNIWDDSPTALLSPVLLYDNHQVQHAGMKLAFSGVKTAPVPCNIHLMKGASFEQLIQDFSTNSVWSASALTGALLAFNRQLFLSLGGFDPIFGRGDFEDVDLSLRWKESVGPLLMTHETQLVHLERQTMNVFISNKRQWQERFNACCALHVNKNIQDQAEAAWS